jgi:hypothetical protein
MMGGDVLRVITEYLVPRARHLQIGTAQSNNMSSGNIKDLLSSSSSALEELTLQVCISCSKLETTYNHAVSTPWKQLKKLNLLSNRYPKANAFWEWLWKGCGTVQQLRVDNVGKLRHSLVEGIVAHMPRLNKIHLYKPSSEDTEAILSTRHQGWKEVFIACGGPYPQLSSHLMKHSVTLERLTFYDVYGMTDKEIAQLLACCPSLRDFTDTQFNSGRSREGFNAQFFIDQDRDGSLKPWMCETSLRILKIRIRILPRTDAGEDRVTEYYPGQAREIQKRVYDRLARFTHLETLCLGGEYASPVLSRLEMSLKSGLDKLSGLKRLKELDVSNMRSQIGKQEVKWMAKQWPKLRVIRGLPEENRTKKAVKWLQQNHPEIILR